MAAKRTLRTFCYVTLIGVITASLFLIIETSLRISEWFNNARQNDYFISDVFLGLRGLPHFIVAVRQEHQGTNWILRSTIDFKAFNNLVENLRIGKTGFAFILSKSGDFQTKPTFEAEPDVQHYLTLLKDERACKKA